MSADLQRAFKPLVDRKAKPDEFDAVLRDVVERHGARLGSVLDTAKLQAPLRQIVEYGAAKASLQLLREYDGQQRWILTDSRWCVFLTSQQATNSVAAGVTTVQTGVPMFAPVDGPGETFAAKPSHVDVLEQYGIGALNDAAAVSGRTNAWQARVGGVLFAVDALAVLGLMGATHIAVDRERRLAEGRGGGRVVGYVMGMTEPGVVE